MAKTISINLKGFVEMIVDVRADISFKKSKAAQITMKNEDRVSQIEEELKTLSQKRKDLINELRSLDQNEKNLPMVQLDPKRQWESSKKKHFQKIFS